MEKLLTEVNNNIEQTKAKRAMSTRNKVVLGLFGLFILLIIFAVHQANKSAAQPYTAPAVARDSAAYKASLPKYTVAFHVNGDDYKKPSYYYLSMDFPKLADGKFKEDVKAVTKDMLSIYGDKIVIQYSDDTDTLQSLYREQASPESVSSNESYPNHLVATYTGNIDTGAYSNTLVFFPDAFTTTPQVGSLKETVSFK